MGNTDYSFDTIVRTASSGSGLTGFENKTSINDSGKVAVVGKFGFTEDILVGDAVNPVINLSSDSGGKFSSPVEINNNDLVVAVDTSFDANFNLLSAVRLWDANDPGSFKRNIATGNTNRFNEDFENILPAVSLSNRIPVDQVAFLADPIGPENTALETYAGFNSTGRAYNELVQGAFRPMVADNGRVVVGNSIDSLVVRNYELNLVEPIANVADGFTRIGDAPGISDNGKAVAFYGEKSGKKGIFISLDTDSGWVTHQVASISGDGILDPGGEIFNDDGDGNVELGEDTGIIGDFDSFERIGITHEKNETFNSDSGTVTYLAKDLSGNESIVSTQFDIDISNSSSLNVSHSEVVKAGDSASKFDSTLTGNIQDLNIYDPINASGQVAFWAKTTTGEEAVVRANPIRKPVFIVPGIIGSLPRNEDVNEWLTNRGFSPDRLQPEQISNIYDDLIETLKRAGYVEGVDLFVATYDWRLNPAPIDGNIDGVIKRSPTGTVKDSVNKLTDNKYEYSVDQFAFWLQESIEGWKSQFSDLPPEQIPELDSVDVIAHSAGGATVRSYIQSDAYGQVFNSKGTKLPEINNFISLGVPYRGASIPWNGLNNNFSGGVVLQLAKLIAGAAYAKARNGSTISLSGQSNVPEAITTQEVNTGTVKEFIEDYVPHLRALLATYPFIEDSSGNLQKAEELDPQSRNELLLDLNDGFDSINNEGGGNPTKFADKIRQLAVVYGSGIAANDALLQKTGPDFEQALDSSNPTPSTPVSVPVPSIATLDRGKVAPERDEIWYKNLPAGRADPNRQGDQTVPLLSATGFFSEEINNPNYRDNILFKDFPSVTHNQQPFDLEVQQYILDLLKIDLEEDLISTNLNETK